ncbi:transposase (plasmid) [Deinococcus radiomollis]|uniref:transposase n=1 Tax=Deinococcus radiomollis TaxID=468916 RepID=UPI0038925EA6
MGPDNLKTLGVVQQVHGRPILLLSTQLPETQEAKVRCQRRAGIKATISQGVRAFALRRSRYTSIEKTHLQHVLTVLAVNVVRLVAWWDGEHPGGTRVSRFAQLRVA